MSTPCRVGLAFTPGDRRIPKPVGPFRATALVAILVVLAGRMAMADDAPPTPPDALVARDAPNDVGTTVLLTWRLSPDDRPGREPRVVKGYRIYRTPADRGANERAAPELVGEVPYGTTEYADRECSPGSAYLYEVVAVGPSGVRSAPAVLDQPVRAVRQWFDRSRGWFGVLLLLVCGAVLLFTRVARAGKKLHVREIAGLQAIEEAVGRATEMGRPCLFIPGLQDMNDIATVAGVNVLAHVAETAAAYEATITVPTARSLVMTSAREAVHGGCLAAGRPDVYDANQVYYVTDEQFAFVAHVTGYMVREKPAACFYAGTFFAESLILAETGNLVGALQIAGTAESSQLPFFVAACDYTLIGEELFAASAYLSGEPDQLGSLKGQDFGKALAGALLIAGCTLATLANLQGSDSLAARLLAYLKEAILGREGMG